LEAAAASVRDSINGRRCFLAIKNGQIVHEEYYANWDEASTFYGMSTTKTHCGTLFDIAVQQGWASVDEKVSERMSDTLFCNPNATWKHVLTMTGENPDAMLDTPEWTYDFYGERCLELIPLFVSAALCNVGAGAV
jgi:CubicO group peptidase (beta-lactamase class C family)